MRRVVVGRLAKRAARIAGLIGALGALSACEESHLALSPDFGTSVRAAVVGQIADPDAHYQGAPAPGSDGARASIALIRYRTDKVIQPASVNTSNAAGSSGGNAPSGGTAGAPQ